MLLGKDRLNTIEVVICKALINSYISHNEFASVNNMLRECNEMKEEIENPETYVIPVNSPGFAERLLVSMVISRSPGFHFLSPGFLDKTIFCCFFKTITRIRFISFIYYIDSSHVQMKNGRKESTRRCCRYY